MTPTAGTPGRSVPRPGLRPSAVGLAALVALGAWAGSAPALAQSALRVTPSFAASETYTDTSRRTSGHNGGEFITRISPGISLSSRGGRVQGNLSYTLNATHYSEHPQARTIDNALSASALAELVDNWAYVDVRAAISKQNLSAFGRQTSPDSLQFNPNQAEVGTLRVSPYVRGQLAGSIQYDARVDAGLTETRGSSNFDSRDRSASLSLSSLAAGTRLGWSAQAQHQVTRFKVGRETSTQRINASLIWRPDPDLQLNVSAGQERTNVGAAFTSSYDNWGAGLRWTPTERTNVVLRTDRRYYGDGHSLSVEHRMRRFVVRISDARDATSGAGANGVGQPTSLYQLLFAQFASAYPDPLTRDQAVRDFLRQIGRSPDEIVSGGALSSGVTLQRRQDLSFALLGIRTTLNASAFSSQTEGLDLGTQQPGGGTRQSGVNLGVSYRLTPTSALSLSGNLTRTDGNNAVRGNDLKSVSLGWSGQPGRRASLSLSARYAVFNSPTDPYREASLTASVGISF